jgi:hypothetical protein
MIASGSALSCAHRQALRNSVRNTAKLTTFVSIAHSSALATVSGIPISSVYPEKNLSMRDFFNVIPEPRESLAAGNVARTRAISTMWSYLGTVRQVAEWWQPNHFVPLVRKIDQLVQQAKQSSSQQNVDRPPFSSQVSGIRYVKMKMEQPKRPKFECRSRKTIGSPAMRVP